MVVLAAREFFVVGRCIEDCEVIDTNIASPMQCEMSNDAPGESSESLREAVGSRVESNCRSSSVWEVFTLINFDPDSGCILVSDQGVVYTGVQHEQIRVPKKSPANQPSSRDADARLPSWARDERASLSRAFPFLASRQRNDHQSSSDKPSNPESRVLKRNWSAISLVDAMRPVDLDLSDSQGSSVQPVDCMVFALESEGKKVNLVCDNSMAERPPCLRVKLSMNENLPGTCFNSSKDTTLVGALRLLHKQGDTGLKWPPADKVTTKLFFSIDVDNVFTEEKKQLADVSLLDPSRTSNRQLHADVAERSSAVAACFANRARKLSSRSLGSDDEECQNELCEGLDDVSIQCMEVISLLAEYARDTVLHAERDEAGESLFANNDLSKKLSSQLDDPLAVVGGMLPEWCIKAPSFAPRVFDYESRRRLLERVAFGVSRGTLKQQETKVNVGRLRQRMASLRARAVELVGEAFSGGAEDPTALQLQADELYGMEEALAARVRASFRAVRWQEHVLQVAKAQIRREHLLMDADAAMEQYASDKSVFRRRLEVRFKGESGFDAASGNEAGVTRGFYADVAEALLCCENVAGVYCSSSCSVPPGVASLKLSHAMEIDGLQEMSKLPLWIPDMDASGQVVIPTPRADPRSGLGVYPRPLPHYHPQMPEVLRRFRFIGRLFASALRDGFMFPLPLSSAFLKLVQKGKEASPSLDAKGPTFELVLTSEDLPRAGFLGGEVYAAEMYVCKVLDGIDSADPPLSSTELERMYKEIASDRSFARLALGKSYDCSFEEYFQDRTFVDPLDPSQGEEAVPLCPNGHRKQVTIYNIREWVALAKNFILHDGVMNQALAFRQGVEDFFSASYFRLFTPEELQRDVCGVGDSVDSWDEAAVRKLFKLDGESACCPFWKLPIFFPSSLFLPQVEKVLPKLLSPLLR